MAHESKATWVRFLLLGGLIPFTFSFIVYFGFATNYTLNVYSESRYQAVYHSGVYKYRVLGREAVSEVNRLLTRFHVAAKPPKALTSKLLDPDGTPEFYTAYFIVNTFFLCATCCVLFWVLNRMCPKAFRWISDLSLLAMTLLMTITQYVVVPYDTLSYFFLSVAIWLILRDRYNPVSLALLGLTIVLATLTRETVLLSLAFYVALNFQQLIERPRGLRLNHKQIVFAILAACLAAPYIGLRIAYGTEHAVVEHVLILTYFKFPPDDLGLIFTLGMFTLLLIDQAGRRECGLFLLAASPYLLAILVFASPWETRLACPVFMGLMIIKLRAIGRNLPADPKPPLPWETRQHAARVAGEPA